MLAAGGNPLLAHPWGKSPRVDHVLAEVVGLAPSERPWERLFLVLIEPRAFFDESYNTDGYYVLAGYIASAAQWAKFTAEWEFLLPLAKKDKITRKHRFKMREMACHMESVAAFYKVIEDNVLMAVSLRYRYADLARVCASLFVPGVNIDWGLFNNNYNFAVRALLDMFHTKRYQPPDRDIISKILPESQPIDFYFDDNSAKRAIQSAWDAYVANRDAGERELFGAEPRFDKEERLIPLQAADFWSWWVRKWAEAGDLTKLENSDFGYWKPNRIIPHMAFSASEEEIENSLRGFVQSGIGPGRPIYRVRFFWDGQRL